MPLTSRPVRTTVVAVVAGGLACLGPAATATTRPAAAPGAAPAALATGYSFTAADTRMRSALTARATDKGFGTSFTGTVIDVASNTVVWSKRRDTALKPASTMKLVTAHNALSVWGPDAVFTTYVRQGGGDAVVLVGAGDPGLSSTQISALAATTAADLKARGLKSAHVYVDDSMFAAPSLAPGWKSSYVLDDVTPVRSLVRDQRDLADTSADAGTYLRDRLRANGLTAYYAGRTKTSTANRTIASTRSAAMYKTIGSMLLTSNNDVAEMYHRVIARSQRQPTTWSGARTAQASVLGKQGLGITSGYDGSGLSRSDRVTSYQLARIVDRGLDTSYPNLWPMRSPSFMPTAGRTGTLSASSSRFTGVPGKCAAGKVWAKTGSLSDVVALAGYTTGTDGRLKAFAFIQNGKDSSRAMKQAFDNLAATVNGCY